MDSHTSNSSPNAGGKRLPQSVYYQRRRAAAVVAVVVVALLIVWILSAVGGSNNEDNSAQVAETSAQQPTTETIAPVSSEEAPSEQPAESDAPAASENPTEAAAQKDTCELSDLIIEASTDQPNYPSDIMPTFYMTVKNPTAADCVIDLSEDTPRFEVYNLNTNERIWADLDCNPAVDTGEQTFPPGEERFFSAKWSRTSSTPDSCSSRALVPAGSYFLHTVMGNNASAPYTFNMQ